MLFPGCLTLFLVLFLLLVFPFFLADLMLTALTKLSLSPLGAFFALMGIIVGGNINIPLRRISHQEEILVDPFLFGFGHILPQFPRRQTYTILAVNVGGCLIPSLLALYESVRLLSLSPETLPSLFLVTGANVVVCYALAKPIPGVGIAMPALVPPLVAATGSLLLAPDWAPPVAFVAGGMGALIGADLLHLRDIRRIATGYASIGGAGTFDGIVLSGLIAAFLA